MKREAKIFLLKKLVAGKISIEALRPKQLEITITEVGTRFSINGTPVSQDLFYAEFDRQYLFNKDVVKFDVAIVE